MYKKLFPDRRCFSCVFLTIIALIFVLLDTTGILSLVGIGISVGVLLSTLLQA